MTGLRAGQSMTSTSRWSKKAVVLRAVWGRALPWTYTKLRQNTPVAHGNIWFLRIWMYRCRFMAPSTRTSSLLPPWWIAPHTMTDGTRFPSLGWTQASISLSPCLTRIRTAPSLWYRENRDSSLKIQCLHCLRSHIPTLKRFWAWRLVAVEIGAIENWHYYYYYYSVPPPHSWRCRLCSKVSLGHLAGRRDQYPAARSRLRMVRTDICLQNRRIICIRRRGAVMKQFILTIRSSWWSSPGVEIFIERPHFLWCGRPVSRLRRKSLQMHPWDTPSILATSRWKLPFANNLTIHCCICSGKFCGMIPCKSSKKYQ